MNSVGSTTVGKCPWKWVTPTLALPFFERATEILEKGPISKAWFGTSIAGPSPPTGGNEVI